ncbi:MAG: hypothetical protein LDL53_12640 [Candidatus Hydrogenedens sp.]|nr:hypothetical protein [Candidatus Hydrogenedens sp.]
MKKHLKTLPVWLIPEKGIESLSQGGLLFFQILPAWLMHGETLFIFV